MLWRSSCSFFVVSNLQLDKVWKLNHRLWRQLADMKCLKAIRTWQPPELPVATTVTDDTGRAGVSKCLGRPNRPGLTQCQAERTPHIFFLILTSDCRCLVFFDPRKYILKPKLTFSHFMLIKFKSGRCKVEKHLFCAVFAHESMKKPPWKVRLQYCTTA